MLIGFFAPNIIVFQPCGAFTTTKPTARQSIFASLMVF